MIDPDAPTPGNATSANIRHWLVADVSPPSSATNITNARVLSAYRSPSPPTGSAAHRYTSVLLRQPSGLNVSIYNQTSISNFNFKLFVTQNNLTIVSANFFNASQTTVAGTSASSGSGTVPSMVSTSSAVSNVCMNLWQNPVAISIFSLSCVLSIW